MSQESERISNNRMKLANKKEEQPGGFLYEVYTLVHDLVYILAAITFIFVFAFRLVGVSGDSMFKTLHNNDYLILQNSLFCREYRQGDVVVASVPNFFPDDEPIVKRVIATGGQTVDIVYDESGIGSVYVDGTLLTETYIREPMNDKIIYDNDEHVAVPEGSVFLMGDNRNHSTDSRVIGCVDERYLLGKVLVIAVPGDNSDGVHEGGAREWNRIGAVS